MQEMKDVEKAVGVQNNESAPVRHGDDRTYGGGDNSFPSAGGQAGSSQAIDEAPPTYDSLFGKIKASKRESKGPVGFFRNLFTLFLGTLGCTITLALLLAIPISMIAMGSTYLYDCPRQKYIPIYLIVAGVFGIVKSLSDLAQRIKNKRDRADERNARPNPFDGILSCFLFAWFITGNVWIYSIYNDYDSQQNPANPGRYCNQTLYLYAFWITTATYIVLGCLCFCFCLTGIICGALTASGD